MTDPLLYGKKSDRAEKKKSGVRCGGDRYISNRIFRLGILDGQLSEFGTLL